MLVKLDCEERTPDYNIYNVLGRGSYGTVFKAEKKDNGNIVAIKYMDKTKIPENQPELVDYWRQELQTLQSLKGVKHILQIISSFEDDKCLILITEFYPQTLTQFLRTQPLDINVLLNLIEQLASSIKELHDRFIMHRDLKTDNIMVKFEADKTFNIVLIDLGFAKEVTRLTETQVGTDYTKAPEVKRGEPYSIAADIYSLGIIFQDILKKLNQDIKQNERIVTEIREYIQTNMMCESSERHQISQVLQLVARIKRQYKTFASKILAPDETNQEETQLIERQQVVFQMGLIYSNTQKDHREKTMDKQFFIPNNHDEVGNEDNQDNESSKKQIQNEKSVNGSLKCIDEKDASDILINRLTQENQQGISNSFVITIDEQNDQPRDVSSYWKNIFKRFLESGKRCLQNIFQRRRQSQSLLD